MNRYELKSNAKRLLKRDYWKCVAAALIAGLLTGTASRFNYSVSSEDGTNLIETVKGFTTNPMAVFLAVLVTLGITVLSILIVIAVKVLLGNSVKIGYCRYMIQNRVAAPPLVTLFSVFKENYIDQCIKMFTTDLIIFVYYLLLIVPGVIKQFEYAMVPYILAENPNMTGPEAREYSKELMDGYKMEYFVLMLSFIGWFILAGITGNIVGILFVNPYLDLTKTEFYMKRSSEFIKIY